jgi:hypothetical protein
MSSYVNNAAGRAAARRDARNSPKPAFVSDRKEARASRRKERIAARLKKRAGKKAERVARRNKRRGIVPEPKPKPSRPANESKYYMGLPGDVKVDGKWVRPPKTKPIVSRPKPKPGQMIKKDMVSWTNADGTKGRGSSSLIPAGATRDRGTPAVRKKK